jgi:hypothetical protein
MDLTPEEVKRSEVVFQPKSPFQKWDCINRNSAYDCPNESTLEAVCGSATVRCCEEERCKERAAQLARSTGGL